MINADNILTGLVDILQPETAFENNILPLKLENETLIIGLPDVNDLKLINDLSFDTGLKIEAVEMPADVILSKLKELYPEYEFSKSNGTENNKDNITSDYSNVEFVNQVISGAVRSKVSDIHFEPLEDSFRVRYRIDGYLREISKIPKQRSAGICSRIKVMANLDISEKRRPQDGRIRFN